MHLFDREDRDACGVGFVCDLHKRASREPLDRALEALARLAHRGATGDGIGSADGAGVLTAIPWRLLEPQLPAPLRGCASPRAIGMCFLPPAAADTARQAIADALAREGWVSAHWRRVPVDPTCLGAAERATCPAIYQVVVRHPRMRSRHRLDASLHRARLRAERAVSTLGLADAAIASLSLETIVYKALVSPSDLSWFYADLAEPVYETPFAVFHQRFSTNTLPSWAMAQPFHVLAHNGEINTILGNRLRADRRAREELADAPERSGLAPAVPLTGSDSRSLDAAVDQLRAAGFSLPHAFARLTPRAWENDPRLSARERAFERYQAAVADPWEGPAAIAFADGRYVGMTLDRNGFRPARVIASKDGMICAGSEIGIFDLPPTHVDRMTRLGPGEMLVIDLYRARVLDDRTCRRMLAAARPYKTWVASTIAELPEVNDIDTSSDRIATSRDHIETSHIEKSHVETSHIKTSRIETSHIQTSHIETSCDDITTSSHRHITSPHRHIATSTDVRSLQRLFGYTAEELELILRPMSVEGKEAVGSMGDDTPLAVLTTRRRVLSDYFRQRFAQVTNPPIDPLREGLVLSLRTMIGRRGRFLQEDGVHARVVELRSPVINDAELQALCTIDGRPAVVLPTVFDAASGPGGFERSLDRLADSACAAVRHGAVILVLSDRNADREHIPLPSLLATAAVYQALGRAGLGTRAGIVVDTGEARDAHQVAALLAFGAGAVCPWLAFETAGQLGSDRAYRRALEQGLLKIFSKMGVCTASAYSGSQLFEIVGLDSTVVERFFTHTPHVAGSIDLATIAADTWAWHAQAVSAAGDLLIHPGFHGFRRNGDHHVFNPAMVRAFHTVAGSDASEAYQRFRALVHSRPPTTVRDLLRFKTATPVALDEVEPVDAICRRFFASAMSVGALSPEAHRTLAIAMNRLGARSNSGEGGEEPERFVRTSADWANSTTKQVASARFGVTPAYLASARELQIKMAQGSKPGEGGQLPAEKVVGHIARLRHAPSGTALISPPPHHDIYSIEDLAQLIYDLRSFHPTARINVKLVSTTGIGVIAAGVVKAGADVIQISGHAGGTGASPRGSIKHAGLPWEIGLLEAHRLLTERGTRHRVVLQTDGGLVTGHDVAMAAALGADEFGFGTAALVALGCVMARQCHLNTCPVGIATQRADLRAKYAGTPDDVVTYLQLVAADVRSILASLGLRSLQELVGRVDLLEPRDDIGDRAIDSAPLLAPIVAGPPLDADNERHHGPAGALTLNGRLLARAGTLLGRQPITLTSPVRNTDRAVGATLAGYITRRFGAAGLGARLHLQLTGTAGQSLGAFGVPGLDITLVGAANDGVAKGLHGGTVVVRPPAGLPADCVLVGNAALYGATGGRLFVAGRAGERFAVRNSGASAVVEGVGQHGCEYMTGGVVVVIGPVGRNFAAGMTGGTAYVLDRSGTLETCINPELVSISRLSEDDAAALHSLLSEHVKLTGSPRAGALLARWPAVLRNFRRVKPHEPTTPADLPRSVVAVAHHRARAATAGEHSTA